MAVRSHRGRRNKGQRGEREFFRILNKYLPERLRTKRDLAQAREGGSDGQIGDVVIEVKRQEGLRLPQWLRQLRAQVGGSSASVGVLAYRQNNGQWHCLVDMSPAQLAVYLRYRNNLSDTEKSIQSALLLQQKSGN
jgi:hypothetical protein